jgi:hypothetical protein
VPIVELIVILFGLLAVATPPLTAFLLWRQRELRQQLLSLKQLSVERNDALHRELVELKRQVAALPLTLDPAAGSVQEASRRSFSAAPTSVTPTKTEKPAVPIAPAVEPAAEPAPVAEKPHAVEQRFQPAFCAWCGTVHAGGVSHCPSRKPIGGPSEVQESGSTGFPETQKEEKVPAVRQSTPAAPPTANQPVDRSVQQPEPDRSDRFRSLPDVAASVTPATPPQTARPQEPSTPPRPALSPELPPTETPLAPRPPQPVPPAGAARVVGPPQLASHRSAPAKATARQRMKSVFALEETLGTNWLNKLGIVILVLGVALFGNYELGQLSPAGKVFLSYVVCLALLGGGIVLERRERYRIFGRTLIGGGWALLFFTTYALQHVQAMRVLSSETTDLIFMLAVAIAMAVHTLRYRSQLVTGLAFLLAYTTVSLSHDDVYSLSSGVILAIGLVSIVIKMDWFELEVFGILSSYLNHLYWLYRLLGAEGAQGHAFAEYRASTALLLFYWLIFRASYVVRKTNSPFLEHVSSAAALLNTLLLLGVMKFQSAQPELAALALLMIGALEFSVGQLPITKRRREAFVVLSVLGASLMMAAVPFRYSGNNVAILWLIGAETFLVAGVVVGEVIFRRLGLLTGFLVGAHLAGIDFEQLILVRQASEDLVLTVGVMFALSAIVFYWNGLLIGKRWARDFEKSPDRQLLSAHSYIGGFAAVAAAWALCSRDWTALAFAAIMLALSALGWKLRLWHLQVQYGVVAVLTLYRVVAVNLHTEVPESTHVPMRLFTLPVIAAAFYLTAKWVPFRDSPNQRTLRGLFTSAGTCLLTLLIYYEVPALWQGPAAIGFAVLLLEVGRWIRYHPLAWHAHVLSALAVVAAVTADPSGAQRWHNIPLHAFGALPVVGGAYWIAKRISLLHPGQVDFLRLAYSWVGTGLMVWVLNEAVPAPWIAVAWVVFAVALAFAMHSIGYKRLAWQANAVAACALVRAFTYNLTLDEVFWREISLRLVTVALVAAGLYFLSRAATTPEQVSRRAIAYLHTSAATALLVLLAWFEAPGGWLVVVWAVFSLVLAIVDRRFELEDLAWQAHALAGLTVLRSVTVDLYGTGTWHGVSVRLLSLATVAIVLYALSRVIRMPGDWRSREFHHIYSWAASVLVSLLIWYELQPQPLSIAVGWAVFALVLFEYGLLRGTRQFRFQAYVALVGAFVRIFFANLTAGNPDEFWGPRIYTVLPLTLIFFFVYAQLGPEEKNVQDDRRLHFDLVLGYMGTGSVIALLYFQFANDWLVTAWAAVVFVLLGLALLLGRPIFLHQGLLLTLATCIRGVMHNLFGASYFSGRDWTGRYFVLGSAVAVLFGCLPFAFRLRDRYKAEHKAPPVSKRWIKALLLRPEQLMFFAPVVLLTLMLALKMRAGMVTVAWGIEGVLIVLFALAVGERSYRLTGLSLLLLCVGKLLASDAWGLARRDRYITFIIVGAALLLVSFLYSKYRDTIRQFL